MNKPISIVREEFKQNMIELVNNSNLPMFVVEPIMNEILTEVRAVAKAQFELDKKRYEESLITEANKEDIVDDVEHFETDNV